MGIRISRTQKPDEPYWMDLPFGVRFLVRPIDTAIYDYAAARAARLVRELGEHAEAIETAGGVVSGLPSMADADAQAGLSQTFFTMGLAQAAVLDWVGVDDEDEGGPIVLVLDGDPNDPASPISAAYAAIAMVIRKWPAIANAFAAKYGKPLLDRISEGKGSGTSPGGTMAAVPTIAEGAVSKASLAAGARP